MSWNSEEALNKARAYIAAVRAWLAPRIEQGRQWLMAPREPITGATLRAKLATLKLPSTYAGRLAVLGVAALLLLPALLWYGQGQRDDKGAVTYPHASLINPVLGGLGALFLIYAAIRQARTASAQAEIARKQAQIASDRHDAQTKADIQRRITETFSKAVEQLGSEKIIEVRVGGIYTLERLAREALASQQGAADLYWTVIETLTAFVRERAQWKEPDATPEVPAKSDTSSDEAQPQPGPATDIAAVLEVILRRPDAGREREELQKWRLNLRMTDLQGANLRRAHLEHANLRGAHLEGANLRGAHLEGANLRGARLEGADLSEVYLEGAYLRGAHLEGANLSWAELYGADLSRAFGDKKTRLPDRIARPKGWPAYQPDDDPLAAWR